MAKKRETRAKKRSMPAPNTQAKKRKTISESAATGTSATIDPGSSTSSTDPGSSASSTNPGSSASLRRKRAIMSFLCSLMLLIYYVT